MRQCSDYRRIFHQYPETGWLTCFSSVFIANTLENAGYKVFAGKEVLSDTECTDAPTKEQIEQAKNTARQEASQYMKEPAFEKWMQRMGDQTGVVAIYDTGKAGKTKAYRFDMDGLFVKESCSIERLPVKENFVSKIEGVSHACGHDGHMAIGLNFALRLLEKKEELSGKYIFIFQPAEEGVRGAMAFCKTWKFGKIEELYCMHIGFAPEDTFVSGAKGFLATTKFDVKWKGKSAHAGLAPERGRNALLAAARAAIWMEDMERPTGGITRLNVGQLTGGESRNTIPANAWMQVETRGENAKLNEYMKANALFSIEKSAEHYGVTYEITYKGESVSACSSPELARSVLEKAKELNEFAYYEETYDFGASDDGAVFMDMVQKQGGQAIYMLLGCKMLGLNHEDIFDFDEKVMEKGVNILIETLE